MFHVLPDAVEAASGGCVVDEPVLVRVVVDAERRRRVERSKLQVAVGQRAATSLDDYTSMSGAVDGVGALAFWNILGDVRPPWTDYD